MSAVHVPPVGRPLSRPDRGRLDGLVEIERSGDATTAWALRDEGLVEATGDQRLVLGRVPEDTRVATLYRLTARGHERLAELRAQRDAWLEQHQWVLSWSPDWSTTPGFVVGRYATEQECDEAAARIFPGQPYVE